MIVKVLGSGCKNCETIHKATLAAVNELQLDDTTVEYINDMNEIIKYVMVTPGLVVDEVVIHEGKLLPNMEQIKALLRNCQQSQTSGGFQT